MTVQHPARSASHGSGSSADATGIFGLGCVLLTFVVWALLIPLLLLKVASILVAIVAGFLFTLPGALLLAAGSLGAKAIGRALPEPHRTAWLAFVARPDGWGFARFGRWWYLIVFTMTLLAIVVLYLLINAVVAAVR